LAPHETQRLVVSGKTGTCSSATPGKNICVPIDPGGEMVTLKSFRRRVIKKKKERKAKARTMAAGHFFSVAA